jgi:hypothetical protein
MDDLMAMMGDILDDDRLRMPYPERWAHMDKIHGPDTLTYRLVLGSVMGFSASLQGELADRCRATLNDVGRISKDVWTWHTCEETVYGKPLTTSSQPQAVLRVGEDGEIGQVPVDQVKYLYINFASRDDAMLVRMTIADLRSVKDVNGGGVPQTA